MPFPPIVKYIVKEFLLRPVVRTHGKTGSKRFSLTFDDGPNPVYTPKVLDVLRTYDVKATFFWVGDAIMKYPDYIDQIIEDGHEFGCHTMGHRILSEANKEIIEKEISEFFMMFPSAQRILRPPHGKLSLCLLSYSFKNKVPIILWTLDPKDFRVSREEILQYFARHPVQDGDIVLLHDKTAALVDVLSDIIEDCLNRGLKGVTVTELLRGM